MAPKKKRDLSELSQEENVQAAEEKATRKKTTGTALDRARASLTKIIKGEDPFVSLNVSDLTVSHPHIPSKSIMLDYLIGGEVNEFGTAPCPGVPRGRITNIYGEEGSGKSTFCQQVAASATSAGGSVCYIDWEHAIVTTYAHQLGVPIYDEKKFLLAQPTTLEDGMAIAISMAREGVDLIVFDSVGAGITRNQYDKTDAEIGDAGPIGLKARIWGEFLPQMQQAISKTGTSVIAVSQLRKKIGFTMPGRPPEDNVQGGEALKYYSSLRLRFKKIGKIESKVYDPTTGKKEALISGTKVKAKIDKSKVSGSYGREIEFYIEQGKGIDNTLSMIDLGLVHKFITGGGKTSFCWTLPNGDEISTKGLPNFKNKIHNDPELQQILWNQVRPLMSTATASDSSDEEEN